MDVWTARHVRDARSHTFHVAYSGVPGSVVVLLDAGYLLWRYPDGFRLVPAHGGPPSHQPEIEGVPDIAELLAPRSPPEAGRPWDNRKRPAGARRCAEGGHRCTA